MKPLAHHTRQRATLLAAAIISISGISLGGTATFAADTNDNRSEGALYEVELAEAQAEDLENGVPTSRSTRAATAGPDEVTSCVGSTLEPGKFWNGHSSDALTGLKVSVAETGATAERCTPFTLPRPGETGPISYVDLNENRRCLDVNGQSNPFAWLY